MTIKPFPTSSKGFTLVELSIVLVIIGLLAGGILTGSYLIKAASSRAVIREVGEFKTAAALFNEKYAEWPGDVTNATALWPTDGTADGDGDGRINLTEGYRAWQHMALAEMIPGSYNGTTSTPQSRMDGGQYGMEYADGALVGGVSWSYGLTGNSIIFYQTGTTPTSGAYSASMEATEAASIDRQLDDGFPTTGKIRAVNNTVSTCVTGTAPNPIIYNLGTTATIPMSAVTGDPTATGNVTTTIRPVCALIFKFSD